MEGEHIVIVIGVLVLTLAIYEYSQPIGPPGVIVTMFTTTEAPSTTALAGNATTSTTLDPYNTRPTFPDWFTTTRPRATTTTTTLIPPSCVNGVKDADEQYVDCGIQCAGCVIYNLSSQWTRYGVENLWFRFEGADRVVGGPCTRGSQTDDWGRSISLPYHCLMNVYYLGIKSTEALYDQRASTLDEVESVDGFEFKLVEDIEGDENQEDLVGVYVKRDLNALKLPKEYRVLTVGGHVCSSNQTGFCRRTWMGYTFELRLRETGSVRLDVTLPSGRKLENVELREGETTAVDDATVGLLYAYQKGGYCTIYVKKSSA